MGFNCLKARATSRKQFTFSVQHLEDTKRAFLLYKKVKKGTPYLTFPYFHSLFTIVLTKQIFEQNKSSRAACRSQNQFLPKIIPAGEMVVSLKVSKPDTFEF